MSGAQKDKELTVGVYEPSYNTDRQPAPGVACQVDVNEVDPMYSPDSPGTYSRRVRREQDRQRNKAGEQREGLMSQLSPRQRKTLARTTFCSGLSEGDPQLDKLQRALIMGF